MKTCLRRWAHRIETWEFFIFIRAIEPLVILIAFIAFFNELTYRHEERMARAWQLLTTPAPGNSGKGEALAYLNSRGISLEGIDLTPPILAEQWKQTPKKERELGEGCTQFTYLRAVELPYVTLPNATLVCADLLKADLRGANLSKADLRGAHLPEANLRGALLIKADLRGADLFEAGLQGAHFLRADLRGAHFFRAGLQGADLSEADLRGAHLIKADLQGAHLIKADLQGAHLSEADLRGALLFEAGLQGADLSKADLRKTKGIQCPQLNQAIAWDTSYRDNRLACGAPIPSAPNP